MRGFEAFSTLRRPHTYISQLLFVRLKALHVKECIGNVCMYCLILLTDVNLLNKRFRIT